MDNNGSTLTPLIVAVRLGNLNAVDMLLKADAKVDQKDSSGKTALDWAREIMKKEGDLNKKAVCEKMVRMLDPSQSSQPSDKNKVNIEGLDIFTVLQENSKGKVSEDSAVESLISSKDRGMV